MVAQGKTINDIAVYLTERGVKPPRKMGWRLTTVHSLLRQDRVIGLLVDEETFNACHTALRARSCPARPKGGFRLSSQGRSDRVWPLANLARCSFCGASVFGYTAIGKGTPYHYLRCTNRAKKQCPAPELSAPAWEAAVCKALNLVLADQGPYAERLNAIAIELQRRANNRHVEVAALVKERDAIAGRQQRLIALAEAGDAPIKGIAERLKDLERELAAADLKVAEMEGLSSASAITSDDIQDLLAQFRAGAEGLEMRSQEDQKRVLSGLLTEVRIGSGKPIELSMVMPDLAAMGGSVMTPGADGPTSAEGVSLGGRGFVPASIVVEAPGIESPRLGPTTSRNSGLYYGPNASYSGFGPSTETASKAAFGHSMVPILAVAAPPSRACGAYQGDEAKRPRKGWRKWMPQLDDQGRPVIEYGFTVTTDPWRIEQIGSVVMWLQERGRLKRAPTSTTPA